MKALVTGASGFIGSTLIKELNTIGWEAHALMRRTSNPAYLKGLQFIKTEGDLHNLESLKAAVAHVDCVFHLAGAVAAPNEAGYFKHNTEGTELLARAVAEVQPKLKRFVYVSSLAAGGPSAYPDKPRTEKDIDAPVSAYGKSKLEAEATLSKFKNLFPVSIIRPPIVYGPKDKGVFIFVQTVARSLMPILSATNGQKLYSSIHAQDLCLGLIAAARTETPSGEVFYLSSNTINSYEEIMTAIAHVLGKRPLRFPVPKTVLRALASILTIASKITGYPFPLNNDKVNELLPDYWTCSNEKAKQVLGFSPRHEFASGIAETIEWYQQQGWI
jgi:nucleoside-diphosphate-sugar epimerase